MALRAACSGIEIQDHTHWSFVLYPELEQALYERLFRRRQEGKITQDLEAAPSQTSSGNSAANSASTTSSQRPSLWDNGDPGDALQLLQSEEDCEALEFTLRGEG